MTNLYVDQALATERIRQLHLDAERYRRARAARAGHVRRSPSRRTFREFVLAMQMSPVSQPSC